MEFQHEPNRIFNEQDGKLLAEVTFPDIDEHSYVIDKTYVDDSLRGQGVATSITAILQGNGSGPCPATRSCGFSSNSVSRASI